MAGLMEKIIGHQEMKSWLIEKALNSTLPSTLIFHGPPGIGKKSLAIALLQIFNCDQEEMACGQCSRCVRIQEKKNEMVYHLETGDKKSISVDSVREMQSFFNLKSDHKARFVIIDQAEKLSIAASNSLLKLLEEPPPGVYFILVTDQVSRLLVTIRSRSHILNFSPLTAEELNQPGHFNDLAVQWSDGRYQLALELQDENRVASLNESIQLFYSLLCESPQDWKKKAPWFFNSEELREFCLNIWKQALEKRLYNQSDNLEFIPSQPGRIGFLFDQLESLNREIQANVDKLLALENFYYRSRSAMMAQ